MLFFMSFFAALIFALSVFLQAGAAWWKGPLAAIGLFVLCLAIALLIPAEGVGNTVLPPVLGLATAAFAGSVLIGLGSLVGIIGRRFATPGRLAGIAFVPAWILLTLLFLAL